MVNENKNPTRDELLTRARNLVPTLKERAAECEELRRLPDRSLDDFIAAGLFNVSKPKRYGGYELGYDVLCEITMALAKGCASSAWNFAVLAEHNVTISNSSRELLDEVWGDTPDALISSGNNPRSVATPVDGGYRLSTTISFSSGCDHAEWWITGAMVEGTERRIGLTIARDDAQIIDNWHTVGLAGTGSKDVKFDDVFVPLHRVRSDAHSPLPGGHDAGVENPANYLLPQLTTKPYSLSSVAVGVAAGVLEDFTEEMKERSSRFGAKIAEFQSLQLRIAESASEEHAARTALLENLRESLEYLKAGNEMPVEMSNRNWRDMAWASKIAAESVARIFYAAGANGLFTKNNLQRQFRDVHAVSKQIIQSWDIGGTAYGRGLLGLPDEWPHAHRPLLQ